MSAPLVTVTITRTAPAAPPFSVAVSRDAAAPAPEPSDAAPFSFAFTGRHDAGALPAPAATGHYAALLDAVAEAKARIDAELTREIDAAKRARTE